MIKEARLNASTYTAVATAAGGEVLRFRGLSDAAALTSLRVSTKVSGDGTSRVYLADADLDVPSSAVPYTSKTDAGASLYQTAAGNTFEFALDARGFDSVTIEAKAAGSTKLTLEVGA